MPLGHKVNRAALWLLFYLLDIGHSAQNSVDISPVRFYNPCRLMAEGGGKTLL